MINYTYFINQLNLSAIQNKYTKWYCGIISSAISRYSMDPSVQIIHNRRRAVEQLGYVEGHHIIPKSINSAYDKSHYNVVFLTSKEHFICHWLLTKMFLEKTHTNKMIFAFRRMHHGHTQRYTSRYSSKLRSSMPPANLGKIHITDGIVTKYHNKTCPIPKGWSKGSGKLYKEHRALINDTLHSKLYSVTNIITNKTVIISNLSKWALTNKIPKSTVFSSVRDNTILRKLYEISEVKEDTL